MDYHQVFHIFPIQVSDGGVSHVPSQMLHAGICTRTFTPFLWPSFVGKYSTMVRIWD